MAVDAIASGSTPYVPKVQSGGDESTNLQNQKETLEKQLEVLKSKPKNSQAEQDAAVNEKEILENQIAEIDKKLQTLSKGSGQGQNTSKTTAMNTQKSEASKSSSLSAPMYSEKSNQQEEDISSQSNNLKNIGNIIDAYA